MTVMEGSGKSRMCLQHDGNLKVPLYIPRNGSLATEISVKANLRYALRYNLEWFIRFWKHPFDHSCDALSREDVI